MGALLRTRSSTTSDVRICDGGKAVCQVAERCRSVSSRLSSLIRRMHLPPGLLSRGAWALP
eukprot:3434248-Alexandrium_andersonii.AAC.1